METDTNMSDQTVRRCCYQQGAMLCMGLVPNLMELYSWCQPLMRLEEKRENRPILPCVKPGMAEVSLSDVSLLLSTGGKGAMLKEI